MLFNERNSCPTKGAEVYDCASLDSNPDWPKSAVRKHFTRFFWPLVPTRFRLLKPSPETRPSILISCKCLTCTTLRPYPDPSRHA
jgi:hypothetical protein